MEKKCMCAPYKSSPEVAPTASRCRNRCPETSRASRPSGLGPCPRPANVHDRLAPHWTPLFSALIISLCFPLVSSLPALPRTTLTPLQLAPKSQNHQPRHHG